jgi:hypothetical protein
MLLVSAGCWKYFATLIWYIKSPDNYHKLVILYEILRFHGSKSLHYGCSTTDIVTHLCLIKNGKGNRGEYDSLIVINTNIPGWSITCVVESNAAHSIGRRNCKLSVRLGQRSNCYLRRNKLFQVYTFDFLFTFNISTFMRNVSSAEG